MVVAMRWPNGTLHGPTARRLIVARFADDALLQQEIEAWLDQVVAPDEDLEPDCPGCEAARICYCHCESCLRCQNCWKGEKGDQKSQTPGTEASAQPQRTEVGPSSAEETAAKGRVFPNGVEIVF